MSTTDYATKRFNQAYALTTHLRDSLKAYAETHGGLDFDVIVSTPSRDTWEVRVEFYQGMSGFRSLALILNGDALLAPALRVVLAAVEALP